MLNKLSLKNILTSMLVTSIIIFGGYKANAQEGNFVNNTGGTYKTRTISDTITSEPGGLKHRGGIIRMKGAASHPGEFTGTAALGDTVTRRISGTVIWAKNADQKVQPRYYTNLGVAEPVSATAGDHKRTFGVAEPGTIESYYVSGDFMRYENTLRANPITDAQALYFRGATSMTDLTAHGMSRGSSALLPIIEHLCLSDFWYDGDPKAQMVLGSITDDMADKFGVVITNSVDDNYYTFLNQWNSTSLSLGSFTQAQVFKQLASTNDGRGSISIGAIHVATGSPLNILLADACDSTGKDTTIIDTLEVDTCGSPTWTATHPGIDCPPPCTGPGCDTADPCADGPALWAGADVVIKITGSMNYAGLDSNKNIPFCFYEGDDCRDTITPGQEPTRVIYADGAVGVYPAHYGILQIAESGTNVGYDLPLFGNVYIKGKRPYALDHYGTNNLLTYSSDSSGNWADTFRIVFEDVCADATYNACGEVVGWIYRNASTPDKLYTYHNRLTTLALDGVPSTSSTTSIPFPNSGYNQWFGLMSIPGSYLAGNSISGAETKSKALKNSSVNTTDGFDESQYGYINRIWEVNFAAVNDAAAISEMNLGYLFGEVDSVLLNRWAQMRGYEAWDSDEYPTSLVGLGGNPWEPTAAAPTSGGGSFSDCNNMFAVNQAQPVLLTGEDPEDGDAEDISRWSQILIGNIPTIIQSVQSGRWSNPATWGGVTPQKDDSVFVRHLVYTGIFDTSSSPGDILGTPQWSVNEHSLPGVYDTATSTYILARSVTIVDETTLTTANAKGFMPNEFGYAALIIGNHEIAGTAPAVSSLPSTNRYRIADNSGEQMEFSKVLTFGTIYNNNNKTHSSGTADDNVGLNVWTDLQVTPSALAATWSGLHVMGRISAGLWNASPVGSTNIAFPVINIYEQINAGKVVNEGIIEIGK
ncbi:MAG: hypothetical protein FWG85_06125 [Bacteroidetes bacterium]|nr:hypothetical protein [Bacteroidota bacterium]